MDNTNNIINKELYLKLKNASNNFNRYKNFEVISNEELLYICSVIDMKLLLKNIGVDTVSVGDELKGYCPDHFLRTGRYPSHPKWFINVKTGKCFCHTESYTSNIVRIVKNVCGFKTLNDAKEFILGKNEIPSIFEINRNIFISNKEKSLEQKNDEIKQKHDKQINEAKKIINLKKISQNSIDFFKKDNIFIDTLIKFNVASSDSGMYKDRSIVPFFNDNKEIVGFVAIDNLGKKKWCKNKVKSYVAINGCKNYSELRKVFRAAYKSYRKVVFCSGSSMGEHLFGLNEYILPNNCNLNEIVIVEGERDAIKLLQEGITAVSTHGAKLTISQRNKILSLNPEVVYLAYDGDEAGVSATKKAFEMLNGKVNFLVKVNVPKGKDPKKFNGNEFRELMKISKEKSSVDSLSPFERG